MRHPPKPILTECSRHVLSDPGLSMLCPRFLVTGTKANKTSMCTHVLYFSLDTLHKDQVYMPRTYKLICGLFFTSFSVPNFVSYSPADRARGVNIAQTLHWGFSDPATT